MKLSQYPFSRSEPSLNVSGLCADLVADNVTEVRSEMALSLSTCWLMWPSATRDIFRLGVEVKHDVYVVETGLGICRDSLIAEDLKRIFYDTSGECIEGLFRQRMRERPEED